MAEPLSGPHTIYLGLGSNLGDRQLNIALAISHLRRAFEVDAASPVYDTAPVGVVEQPRFINMVVRAFTHDEAADVLGELQRIERLLGRRADAEVQYGPRPIDIDLLMYDDAVLDRRPDGDSGSSDDDVNLQVPHPRMHERAFVLVPLADLAPDLLHPVLGETIATLCERVDTTGVERLEGGLLTGFSRDIQVEEPHHSIGLERAGVLGIERVIRLTTGHPVELFYAQLDMFVDLPSSRKGVHMSRFPDLVDQTLDDLMRRDAPDVESLAGRVAEDLVRRQGAARAEVRVQAKVPRTRHSPLSAQRTQDIFTLLAYAVSNGKDTVRLVGVEVDGMTACPCAQDMVRDHARERLLAEGFSADDAELALSVIPIATHSQRGQGTLIVSQHPSVSADDLVNIVEAGMSSEIYELLKRPDEFFVVNRAHQNPKFVEDVVRDMLCLVADSYPDLPHDAFVLAKQVNFESIHRHDVFAERGTLVGELRRELAGGPPGRFVRLEGWLETALNGTS